MKRLKNLKLLARKEFIPNMEKLGFKYQEQIFTFETFTFERVCNGICQGVAVLDVSSAGHLEVYTYFKAVQIYDEIEYPIDIVNHKYSYNFPGNDVPWNVYDVRKNDFETFATEEQLQQILDDMLKQIKLFSIPMFAVFSSVDSYIHKWALDIIHQKYDDEFYDHTRSNEEQSKIDRELYFDIEKNYLSKYNKEYDSLINKAQKNIQKNHKAFEELKLFVSDCTFSNELQNVHYLTNDKLFIALKYLENYLQKFGFELDEERCMYIRIVDGFAYEKVKIERSDLVFFSVSVAVEDEEWQNLYYKDNIYYAKSLQPKNMYEIYGLRKWFIGDRSYIKNVCQEIIDYLEENRIIEEMQKFSSLLKEKKTEPSGSSNPFNPFDYITVETECFSINNEY